MRPSTKLANEVRPWRFPPAADPVAAAPVQLDTAAFVDLLGRHLGPVAGTAVVASYDQTSLVPPPTTCFVRDDGWRLAVTVPLDLVGALVGVRCGGPFARSSTAGAGGAAIAVELTGAILAAADEAWPGTGGWQAGTVEPQPPRSQSSSPWVGTAS